MTSEAGGSYFTAKKSEALMGDFGEDVFPCVFLASLEGHWFCLKKATVTVPAFSAYEFAGLIINYSMTLKLHFFLFFFFPGSLNYSGVLDGCVKDILLRFSGDCPFVQP